MKKNTLLIICLAISFISFSQEIEFKQDFESLQDGSDVLKAKRNRLFKWGQCAWSVMETEGEGFEGSNKYAVSKDSENATLVKYNDLEAGATYVFSVAVKLTDVDQSWKSSYSVKVLSPEEGSKENHVYGVNEVKDAVAGQWKKHNIEFTVVEGKEKVVLHVYRWAKGVSLNVDDFTLVKK